MLSALSVETKGGQREVKNIEIVKNNKNEIGRQILMDRVCRLCLSTEFIEEIRKWCYGVI